MLMNKSTLNSQNHCLYQLHPADRPDHHRVPLMNVIMVEVDHAAAVCHSRVSVFSTSIVLMALSLSPYPFAMIRTVPVRSADTQYRLVGIGENFLVHLLPLTSPVRLNSLLVFLLWSPYPPTAVMISRPSMTARANPLYEAAGVRDQLDLVMW